MSRTALSWVALPFATALLSACTYFSHDTRVDLAELSVSTPIRNATPLTEFVRPKTDPWAEINDQQLTDLLMRARIANQDIVASMARIDQARARARGAEASRWPRLDADVSFTRQRTLEPGAGIAEEFNQYDASLAASWELDLFSHLKNESRAANADLTVRRRDLEALQLIVMADTAAAYFEWLGFHARLTAAEAALAAQGDIAGILRSRARAGLISDLDPVRAEALAAATGATLPALREGIETSLARIAVLVGTTPSALAGQIRDVSLPDTPAANTTVTAVHLLARPDIAREAAQLEAADARVAARVADRLPLITLGATVGSSARSVDDLFKSATGLWSVGPGLLLPLIDGGRRRSAVDQARAVARERAAILRSTYLNAIQETESSLAAVRERNDAVVAWRANLSAEQLALRLSSARYRAGLEDFSPALEAQRNVATAQDGLITARQSLLLAHIDLWQATGGSAAPTEDSPPRR